MRRTYMRFSADRQAIFLKALRQTGLVVLAVERAGVHRDTAYAHRRADAAFAASWADAKGTFRRRREAADAELRAFVDRLLDRPPGPASDVRILAGAGR